MSNDWMMLNNELQRSNEVVRLTFELCTSATLSFDPNRSAVSILGATNLESLNIPHQTEPFRNSALSRTE
jgi:hypothetical protein